MLELFILSPLEVDLTYGLLSLSMMGLGGGGRVGLQSVIYKHIYSFGGVGHLLSPYPPAIQVLAMSPALAVLLPLIYEMNYRS